MSGLKRSGIELTAEGAAAFENALTGANRSIQGVGQAAVKAGGLIKVLSGSAEVVGSKLQIAERAGSAASRSFEGLSTTGSVAAKAIGSLGSEAGQLGRALFEMGSAAASAAFGGLLAMSGEAKRLGVHILTLGRHADGADVSLLSLSGVAGLVAKALDHVKNQAQDAGQAIVKMGNHALAASVKFATMGAAVGAVGLLGFAAGAGVVTAGLVAMYAAAGGAVGAFLGFGVIKNITDEAEPLQQAMKQVNKELANLEKKGITSGPVFDQLQKQMNDLKDQYDKTFMGMAESLKRFAESAAKTISKPLFDVLKVQLSSLVSFVNSPLVQGSIPKLTQRVADGIASVSIWFERSKPSLIAWGRAILSISEALSGPVQTSLKMLLLGFGKVGTAGQDFQSNVSQITRIAQFFGQIMATSSTILNGFIGGIIRGLAPALDRLAHGFEGVIARAGGLPAFLDRVSAVSMTIGRSLGGVIGAFIQFGVSLAKAAQSLGLWDALYRGIQKGAALIVSGLGIAGARIMAFADGMHKDMARLGPTILIAIKLFEGIAIAVAVAAPILSQIALVAGFLLNPFGLLIAAVSFLGAAFITNFGGIRDKAIPVLIRLKKFAIDAKNNLLIFWAALTNKGTNLTGLSKTGQVFFNLGVEVRKLIPKIIELYKVFSPLAIAFRAIEAFGSGGMAGALASLGDSFSNIGTTILSLIPKIEPIVLKLGRSIITTLGSVLPGIITTVGRWGLALLSWVEPYLQPIIDSLLNLVGHIAVWVLRQVPMLIRTFFNWGVALIGWIAPTIPPILSALGNVISQLVNLVVAYAPTIAKALIHWGVAFLNWAIPIAGQIANAVLRIATVLINSVADNFPAIMTQLGIWAKAFWSWIGPAIPPLLSAMGNLAMAVFSWIRDKAPDIAKTLGAWTGAFLHWVQKDLVPKLPGLLSLVVHGVLNFLNTAFQAAGVDLSPLFSKIGTSFDGAIKIALDSFKTFKAALSGDWASSSGINPFVNAIGSIGLVLRNDVIPAFLEWGPKILDVVQAFNPLSIALTAIQGFMAGGLSGAIDAVTGKLTNAGKAVGIDLTGPLNVVSDILKNTVIPIFNSLVNVFQTSVFPALSKFWTEAGPKIMDIFKTVGAFIADTLIPALGKIANTFISVVLPAVVDFIDNGLKTMLPILKGVIDLGTDLFDKLAPFTPLLLGIVSAIELIKGIQAAWAIATGVVTAAQWLLNVALTANPIGLIVVGIGLLIAAIVLLASNWDSVVKVLGDGWNWIADNVFKPFGDAIGGLVNGVGSGFGWLGEQLGNIWTNIQNAAKSAWDFLNNYVFKPIGQAVDTVRQAFLSIVDGIRNGFRSAINFVIGGINVLIRGANTLIDGLNVVNPFSKIGHIGEIGLAQFAAGGIATRATPGIFGEAGAEALLPINRIVPLMSDALQQAFQRQQSVNPVASPSQIYNQQQATTYAPQYNYNLGGVNTAQSTGSVIGDFNLLKAMAPSA
jgi:hypothetical protein